MEYSPSYYRSLAKKNVFVNTMRVGVFNTKLLRAVKGKNIKKRTQLIPAGRIAEIKELFKNAEIFEREAPHANDESNESIVDQTDFYPEYGGFARVSCTDWSEKMFTENGWEDSLKIMVGSEEFLEFVSNEAYK